MVNQNTCPTCESLLESGTDECLTCGQLFCPDCRAPIKEDDVICPKCSTEFAFFCPGCDREVDALAVVCEHCGMVLEIDSVGTDTWPDQVSAFDSENNADSFTALCPVCHSPVYAEDGFCNECGQLFCAICGHPTKDEDERCPGCNARLYFECPSCGFDLVAGTDICPSCGALFPQYCPSCASSVTFGDSRCTHCDQPLTVRRRKGARTVQSFVVGQRVFQLVACPSCGKNFDPVTVKIPGTCPKCGLALCLQCHIVLESGEQYCPRCGPIETISVNMGDQGQCPNCHFPISADEIECDHCRQQLCPACQAAIAENDIVCPSCGVPFDLFCPACDSRVTIEGTSCPACGLAF